MALVTGWLCYPSFVAGFVTFLVLLGVLILFFCLPLVYGLALGILYSIFCAALIYCGFLSMLLQEGFILSS